MVDHTIPFISISSSPSTIVSCSTLDFSVLLPPLTSMRRERFFTNEVLGFTVSVITILPVPDVALSVHQSCAELLESVNLAVQDSLPVIVSS